MTCIARLAFETSDLIHHVTANIVRYLHWDNLLSLCKATNVKINDNQFLPEVPPAAKGGLSVSARLLALPGF